MPKKQPPPLTVQQVLLRIDNVIVSREMPPIDQLLTLLRDTRLTLRDTENLYLDAAASLLQIAAREDVSMAVREFARESVVVAATVHAAPPRLRMVVNNVLISAGE